MMIALAKIKTQLQHSIRSPQAKKKLLLLSFLFITSLLLWTWIDSRSHISTDDAYINANIVQISPQITGRVINLYVTNNQFVRKGQSLLDIDPRPYEIAVDKAKVQLALAYQGVAEKNAAVKAAQAQVAVRQAEWVAAKSIAERTMKLVKRRVLSQQAGIDITANYEKAAAALDAAKANLDQAQINLGNPNSENNQIQLAKANLRDAQLNLSYTHLVAPSDGIIANLSLRAGTIITSNQALFALISNGEVWIDTNLKETDLKSIAAGQKATITVDMYPGHVFNGEVESISGGSGTAFSLLPPQNATGNWVKITQRVPVRVRIVQNDPRYPLRIGTSATVKIKI